MRILARLILGTLLLGAPVAARAADGWAQLKRGMTADQARNLLGEPILLSEGYGFAIWIYDHGTEVVFYNQVIAWTAPGPGGPVPSTGGQWAFYQAEPGSVPAARPPSQRSSREQPAFFLPVMMTSTLRFRPPPPR